MIGALALFAIFVIAGATSFQFYRGRKENLKLMIDYIKELESALEPVDKTYTMLGLYSGFKAEYLLKGKPSKVVASLGLMPRESIWYYPISLLTLKHDRLYLVYHLDKKKIPKLHVVKERTLKYTGIDVGIDKLKKMRINGETYLVYYKGDSGDFLERALQLVEKYPELLHLALTPETGVLYLFVKPRRGRVMRITRNALNWAREIIARGRA